MLRRLALIVTSIATAMVLAGPADAAFFAGEPVDGPSPDIRSVGDLDIARDGTGAVAYVRRDGGVDHIFVSRLANGAWQPPERVDVGITAAASTPAVAASDGGRVAVVFIAGGASFAVVRQAGAPSWGGPQLLANGASDPSVDMSFNGAAYATYTVNGGDVFAARMDRTATTFVGFTTALDANPANTAGAGAGRSKVAISADGTGVAVWGENNHVFARRMYGTNPSSAVLDLTLADLDGHAGGAADAPSVDIEDDSSFAWVVFRQQFADGAGTTSRAIGVRLRGSRTDPPVAFDGLGWGGQSVEAPSVDINGKGQGIASVGTTGGSALSSVLKDDILNPARPIGGSGAPTLPVGAVAETTDRAIGYLGVADGSVHGVYYDDKTTSRLVPGPGPDTPLTNPALGPADPKAGFDAASDRTGDFAFAYIQGAPDGARSLVLASYDRLPGAFAISTSSKNWRNVNKNPLAWGTALELWGPLTYTVLIDGKPILQTQTTKATLAPAAISEGLHTWRVTATDRRGQSVTTAVKPLKVDTTPPTVSFSAKRKKRVVTVTSKAADVIPPSGNAAGIKYVRIDWGDGSGFEQARKASHAYGRTGAFTIRVSATDAAGNVVVAERTIHIPKK